MAQEAEKPARRLSIITDLLVFILVLIIIDIIVNIFNTDLSISNSEYEQLALVSDKDQSSDLFEIEQENIYYINDIRNKYGITVDYGEATSSSLAKVSASAQQDEVIVNNNLKLLLGALSKYPEDLFRNIKNTDYSITIVLVDSFSNDNLALASRNNLNEYKIYVSNNAKFERAFHHEMYHVLEYYMKSKNQELNSGWSSFNPDGFTYESDVEKLNRDYVYYTKSDLKNAYFVTKYSKVSQKEDRAEIFAELMVMEKKNDYLNEGENIYYKAMYIINDIHKYITGSEMYVDKLLD